MPTLSKFTSLREGIDYLLGYGYTLSFKGKAMSLMQHKMLPDAILLRKAFMDIEVSYG